MRGIMVVLAVIAAVLGLGAVNTAARPQLQPALVPATQQLHEFNCTYANTDVAGSVNCFDGTGTYRIIIGCGNGHAFRWRRGPVVSADHWSQALCGRDRHGHTLFLRHLDNRHL